MRTNSVKTGDMYTRTGPADRDWTRLAPCRQADPELFFPRRGSGPPSRQYVLAVRDVQETWCSPCPVRQECLDYALKLDIRFGIYGGIPEEERPNGGKQ